MNKELIERLREAAASRVASTAMIGADDLIAADDALESQAATPSSHWRAEGAPDPHAGHYDGERAALTMGKLTDDELANGAFMNYDMPLNLAGILAGTHASPIAWMTAVKDRIRWLSRSLEKAAAEHGALADKLRTTEAAYTSAMEAGKALAKQALKAERERDAFEKAAGEEAKKYLEEREKRIAAEAERDALAADLKALRVTQQTPTTDDINLLEWKGMDGVFAFHAIERHADDWNHVARLMNAWLKANREDLVAELNALREREPEVWYDGNTFYANEESASMCCADMDKLRPLYAHPVPAKKLTDIVDDLSQQIRKINGNNSMGACALAEGIAEWADNRLKGEGDV